MAKKANEPRQEANDFGLPQAEFKPIEHSSNNWLIITAAVVGLVLLLGGGAIYWFFFHTTPADPPSLEQEQEQFTPNADMDFVESEPEEESAVEHDAEQDDKHAQSLPEPSETHPSKGVVTKITTPQGLYYVIVGSFIDNYLAEDYAKQLAKKGESAMILFPKAGKNYFRVAVIQQNTFAEANEAAEALKAKYGPHTWVLKY